VLARSVLYTLGNASGCLARTEPRPYGSRYSFCPLNYHIGSENGNGESPRWHRILPRSGLLEQNLEPDTLNPWCFENRSCYGACRLRLAFGSRDPQHSRRKTMIKKIVRKASLTDRSSIKRDLAYWLSRTPEERVATVDYLRRQYHGSSTRLQRSARVIEQTSS
jgi:hypothetical protein